MKKLFIALVALVGVSSGMMRAGGPEKIQSEQEKVFEDYKAKIEKELADGKAKEELGDTTRASNAYRMAVNYFESAYSAFQNKKLHKNQILQLREQISGGVLPTDVSMSAYGRLGVIDAELDIE